MKTYASRKGFTLIELLTVIAIIGILAAIIIPTTGAVRKASKKASTRVQFSNWGAAMEGFKQEYGYYPQIDKITPTGARTFMLQSSAFAIALTGRELNGSRVASVDDRYGNKKERSFYSLSVKDMNQDQTKILDAFGNEEIGVIFDRNGDGFIKIGTSDSDDGTLTNVRAGSPVAVGTPGFSPTNVNADSDIPNTGLRASIIFYSAGAGKTANDLVMSWR